MQQKKMKRRGRDIVVMGQQAEVSHSSFSCNHCEAEVEVPTNPQEITGFCHSCKKPTCIACGMKDDRDCPVMLRQKIERNLHS